MGVVETGGNESWVLDLDFHVFENEVQIIMDSIWVGISAGIDSHLSSLSDIAACLALKERKQEDGGRWTVDYGVWSVVCEEEQRIWAFGILDTAKLTTRSTVICIRLT